MATKSQAKFLYFSTYDGYIAAKSSISAGAIAFVAEKSTIFVKASADKTKEYYVPGLTDELTVNSSLTALSAAGGVALKALITAVENRCTALENKSGTDEADIANIKAALTVLAKAQAANVMQVDGSTSGLEITPGSYTGAAITKDGSIMEGITQAKIKVVIAPDEAALKVEEDGLQIDQSKIFIPQSQVTNLTTDLTAIRANVTDLSTNKVDKVEGKGLSTNDFDNSYKTKLDGIEAGAQVNKLETVKVDGTALTIDASKAVNIALTDAIANKESVHTVKSDDPLLTLSSSRELKSEISLVYDSSAKKIKLTGKSGAVISEFSTTDFVKDGMLQSVEIVENPSGQPEGTYIKFTFNTDAGSKVLYLNVTNLIDLYYADGTTIELNTVDGKKTFNVKSGVFGSYDDVEALKTTVGNASSGLVKNVADASNRIFANEQKLQTLQGDVGTAGSIKKMIYDASSATESKLIGTPADASTAETINAAKNYAKELVNGKNVTATGSGDEYVTLSATAANNAITITTAATDLVKNAVDLAKSAMQTSDIATGSANGTIKVKAHDGSTWADVAVKGLQDAAYTTVASLNSTAQGYATTAKNDVIGTAADAAGSMTIHGIDNKVDALFDWYVE